MKIVVSAEGMNLDSPSSQIFGRCPTYVFVDTDTMEYEALANPAIGAPGGAGIQAAQFVVEKGAQAVVTGNTGPNAFQVFQAAGVPVYINPGGTVREAVEAFRANRLASTAAASAPAHAGMGRGGGMGMGRGMRKSGAGMAAPPSTPVSGERQEQLDALKQEANNLRKNLADIMEKLDRLEKEN